MGLLGRTRVVMIDANALGDRLYADALAADLRVAARFVAAVTKVAWDDIEPHVRKRADAHEQDLCLRPAAMEGPFSFARDKWLATTSLSASTNRPRGCDDQPRRGVARLVSAARHLLRSDGRQMVLQVDREEPGREILRWRFVSLALPPGILVAAATELGGPAFEGVRILHPSFAPDFPVGHQHVHHAAMMSFEELWVRLRRRALVHPGDLVTSLREPRAICPRLHPGTCLGGTSDDERAYAERHPIARARHMEKWAGLLRQTFIAGRLLDVHEGHVCPLGSCGDERCQLGRSRLREFVAGRRSRYQSSGARYPWPEDVLSEERRYRRAEERSWDPRVADRRVEWLRQETAKEARRLVRAFVHVRAGEAESADREYETLLLQYLRVKTAVFGLLIHGPGKRGLRQFLEHFQQIKVYAPEAERMKPRAPNEPGLQVRAIEFRVAPDAWFKRHRLRGGETEDGTSADEPTEFAWLVHFKRTGPKNELPLFGDAIRKMDSEADDIVRALRAKPTHLKSLRGVDICGVEEDQPLWVSADTLRRVREHSRKIAGSRPGLHLEPLRLTVHVGEDFRWLTSGMRAVAEPFHWKLVERGDRIGHGLALTLDPGKWFGRHRGEVLVVKRFDRLLDLAFLAVYAEKQNDLQRKWLRDQIIHTVKSLGFESESSITSAGDVVETTKNLWRSLGFRSTRRLLTADTCRGVAPHERWMRSYLWHRSVQERAKREVRIPVVDDVNDVGVGEKEAVENLRHERALLKNAHRTLLREVARWQVCIESNPTSNLVVGSLDAMSSQDFLARRPTRESDEYGETLTWTISTDDPVTFSTTLADEYAYAWAGMTLRAEKPYPAAYARALLDEAARTSMRMRFTLPPVTPVRDESKNRKRKRVRPNS